MKRIAFMFPGQGSQNVGMGKDFYDAHPAVRTLYEQANAVLEKDITSLMFEGPEEHLTETENTQPALLLSSIAAHTLLLNEGIQPVMTVGHSLGEYSALVASGVISLDKALPLVATRGRLMEEAFPAGKGTMAAVLGLTEQHILEALQVLPAEETVDIANLNCPGQIVISGTKEGIKQAETILKEHGAKRVIPLNVSGPFHSRLMKTANEAFASYLNETALHDAGIPVYPNVTAQPESDSEKIKDLLLQQLYSPVRFEASIRNMMEAGVDAFVEVGSGKVLSGLVRKIDRKMPTFAIHDPESMDKFIAWYKEEES